MSKAFRKSEREDNMFYLAFFIYLAFMFIYGFSVKLKTKDLEEINVSNRSLGLWSSAFSIAATWIWAPALFVSSQKAYQNGVLGFYWFFIPNVLSLVLFAVISINSLKKLKKEHTISELMGNVYSSKRVKRLYDFELSFLLVCSTGVQLLAGGKVISQLIGMDFSLVTVLLALVAFSYSYAKGIKASVRTDAVQMILMIVAVIAAVAFLIPRGQVNFGGIKSLTTSVFSEQNWIFFLAFGLTTTIGLLAGPIGDQTFWQRAFSMKKKNVIKAFVIGAIIFAVIPIGMAFVGFAAAAEGFIPIDVSLVGVEYIFSVAPVAISVLFLLCIISGLSSTLDSNMCAAGAIFSKFSKKSETVKSARFGMVVIGVIGVLIANIPNIDIFWLFLFYGVLRTSVAIPTMITFLFSKKPKEKSIFMGILSAFVIGIPVYTYGALFSSNVYKVVGTLLVLLLPLVFIISGGFYVKEQKVR